MSMQQPETIERQSSGVQSAAASRWKRLMPELAQLSDTLDLVPLLQRLLQLLQKVAPHEAAGIFLMDEDTHTIHGQVTDLFDGNLNLGHGKLPEALRRDAPFLISNLNRRAHDKDESGEARTQIVVPFRLAGHVRGVIILRSREDRGYTEADGAALSEFAAAASARLENALLRQKLAQITEAEAERDMIMAQEIMARLIPREPPRLPGYEIAIAYVPAKIVGGDLIDFVSLVDDHRGILIADAAGNGIPSALLMTGFRALFRGLIKNDFTIRSVFRKANNQLIESTAQNQFVSAFYASIDLSTERLIYVNGGHVPPLLYRYGHPVRLLDVGGPVLGAIPRASYHEDSVVLRPEDILVCFSDGLSEAENDAGETFDQDHILRIVQQRWREPARVICDALKEQAEKFVGHPLRDDLTICVLKYTPPGR